MNPSDGSAAKPNAETALAPIQPVTVVDPPGPITSPAAARVSANGQLIAASKTVHFSGPMPHPELLGQYEQLCPGSANRIIKMAEQEAEHRRAAENTIIAAQIKDRNKQYSESRCGQLCALAITLAALAAGAYTAVMGHEIAGSVIGVGGIGGIVTTFLLGSASRSSDDPPKPPQQPKSKPTRKRRK